MQCHKFFADDTTSDGSRSSWNGHNPIRSAPWRRSSTPFASTRRSSDTSAFNRAITSSGMRATAVLQKKFP